MVKFIFTNLILFAILILYFKTLNFKTWGEVMFFKKKQNSDINLDFNQIFFF